MLTEEELRGGLRALGAGAPAPPPARVASSVRKARLIRTRQVVAGSAAVVALVVPGVVALSSVPESQVEVTSPAHWPERRNPAWEAAADRALADWEYRNDLGAGERVHWLYADEVPGTDHVAVAFATCSGDECSRMVLAAAMKEDSTDDFADPSVSSWIDETTRLRPGGTVPVLSRFLTAEGTWPEDGPENVLLVVGAPGATRVTFKSAVVRLGTGGRGELLRQRDGTFVGRTPYVSADTTVSVYAGDDLLQSGEAGNVGHAKWVAGIDSISGYRLPDRARSQLNDGSDRYVRLSAGSPTFALFVRCAGSAPLRVTVNSVRKTVPCDENVRTIGTDIPGGGDIELLVETTDRYTAYAYSIGVPG